MGKLRTGAIVAGIALAAAFAAPAMAIENAADCQSEGGTMVNVKGSNFCLVPIRDAAYAGEEYDGNQLGVVDCPGSKLNDGAYCMYPVTLRDSNAKVEVLKTPEPIITTTVQPVDEDAVVEDAIDDAQAAMETAEDAMEAKSDE